MANKQAIELLAPAKNLDSGKTAINYGADAVYIGASRFGARAAAGNSVGDIAKLVSYAHRYAAKVFVTLNTLIYDAELEAAERLIHEIYESGADALIIQDMGLLEMNLPPIPLHASTQTHNYELERIRFLDKMNFERIILARELSLDQLNEIRQQTGTELEYFIHGALCVSLSGQCYFSQATTGRSANRGECAQMCRHPYNLVDGNGKRILLNKHLLSLKDLNLSTEIDKLIKAGITSLKIEGRLKDESYVKNVVSYYRKQLDAFFTHHSDYKKASSGHTEIGFTPDPERSFNRMSTSYFFTQRKQGMINPTSPKSMGKHLGKVQALGKDFIKINAEESLHNGDGLCYIYKDELKGLRVEKVVGNKVYVKDKQQVLPGMDIYRNYDHEFTKTLRNDSSLRRISAHISVTENEGYIHLSLGDEDALSSSIKIEELPEEARNADLANENLKRQLKKSGDSIFAIKQVDIKLGKAYFVRMALLNASRRELFELHAKKRQSHFARKDRQRETSNENYPETELDFSANIANQKAAQFYRRHNVSSIEPALEVSKNSPRQLLMTTRYCIKFELGFCQRYQKLAKAPKEPLFIEDKNRQYQLEFDCKNCMMKIRL